MTKHLKVCLAWHNLCSENLGVVALTVSQICMLDQAARHAQVSIEVDTLGTKGGGDASALDEIYRRTGLRVRHIEFDLKKLLKSFYQRESTLRNIFASYDIVIDIGEGDSFSDIYGVRRFIQLFATKQLALAYGCTLILAPQTVGPFNRVVSRLLAKWAMRRADLVYVRDAASADCARALGTDPKQTADVAFSLPFSFGQCYPDSVGINVSGLLWSGGYTGLNQFELRCDYRQLVLDIVRGFRARRKKVHLVSHVLCGDGSIEDDYSACENVKRVFADDANVLVAPRYTSAIDVKSHISGLEFVAASRMHAAIGAVSAGVPTVPLAYSRKFDSLFREIGYPYTLDLRQYETVGLVTRLFGLFDHGYADLQRSAIAAGLRAKEINAAYVLDLEHCLRHAKR